MTALQPKTTPAELIEEKSTAPWRRSMVLVTIVVLFLVFLTALSVGRFYVPFNEVMRMLAGQVFPVPQTWTAQEENIVLGTRLPRVLLAFIVGGGLALAGSALQAVFRNPLVSPQVIGVSSGASFGGVLALLLGLGSFSTVGFAFLAGLAAIWLVISIGRSEHGRSSILMIVLGGIVVSALFSALVSLVTYVADPYTTLPSIVFWLMGSLAAASPTKVLIALVPIALGSVVVIALRWRINVLSLGDDDALSLGVNPQRLRIVLLFAVAFMTAGAVSVSGVIGWVGLVVPHITRLLVGPDHRIQMPVALVVGASYLAIIDTLSRTIVTSELPVGILTSVIGAPVFITILRAVKREASQAQV